MSKLEELKKDELLAVAKNLEAEVESLRAEVLDLEDRIAKSVDSAELGQDIYIDPCDIMLLSAAAQVLHDPQTGGIMDPASFEYNAPIFCEQAVRVAGMMKQAFYDSLRKLTAEVEEVPTRETIPG